MPPPCRDRGLSDPRATVIVMRTRSSHHADVFSHLPVALVRELDTEPVAEVLDALVAAGWRTGQLRHRVGAEPAQGSPERDAAHLLELLRALAEQEAPDVVHARELAEREQQRAWERAQQPPPASPEVRARAIAQIRASIGAVPRPVRQPEPRTRPSCNLCDGEGSYFVTRDVHLCRRCVTVMATGEARLSKTG